jgi:hypothetical protein
VSEAERPQLQDWGETLSKTKQSNKSEKKQELIKAGKDKTCQRNNTLD